MKLQFDSKQIYQLEAIKAVVDIFEGQPLNKGGMEVSFRQYGASLAFNEKGVGNNVVLTPDQILNNLQCVQKAFNQGKPEGQQIPVAEELDGMHFSVEMETGTGKTYTYLRTIYELNKTYGFQKFVIVVPAVPIREGVLKNLEITHEHLQGLYGSPPLDFELYDRKRLSKLSSFAANNSIQILVINIDSFATDGNVINKVDERGIKPIEYIQAVNPIVLVDEPQNMETDTRKTAIENLNPAFTLRYSATHKYLYNQVYRLDPVAAYELGLVKQIEVDSIVASDNYNSAFIEFQKIQTAKTSIKAHLKIYANDKAGVKPKTVKVEKDHDLYELSGKREIYRGFIVDDIDAGNQSLSFSNGHTIYTGTTQGGLTDEIIKFQIERTIESHLKKEKKYNKKGIKVLSLFFIDKVANYREYDSTGASMKGKYAQWFEEAYNKLTARPMFKDVLPFTAEQVHDGYFSEDKQGKLKDTNGDTKADYSTYDKIMKMKEVLLSMDEPLRFIFSHSALREGWDNPNVFQICTLNETKSDMKKRQELGRGLRLPVDSTGKRIFDKHINRLTVIANETYDDFASGLQKEYEEDCNVTFEKKHIKNAREKRQVKLTKDLSHCPEFEEIWSLIRQKTRYKVEYKSEDLIREASKRVKDMPKIKAPIIMAKRWSLDISEAGVAGQVTNIDNRKAEAIDFEIPDVFGYIRSRTGVAKKTVANIITGSGRAKDLKTNPQLFLDGVVNDIKWTKSRLLVDGIKYEPLNGQYYEMQLFENEEIERYLNQLFEVGAGKEQEDKEEAEAKTLYDHVPIDSEVEEDFARDCENDQRVKFYFKLPRGFKIPTPLGQAYNPDWAVVFEEDQRIYFVAETKSTLDNELLRQVEDLKIKCGKAHFAVLEGVRFEQVTKVRDLG